MIGAAIDAVLPLMRANAESLMVNVCDIERQATTWDEALQKSVTSWAPIHMGAPCHFEESPATSRALITDEAVTPETPMVQVPFGRAGIEPDDRVTVVGIGVVWVTHVVDDTHAVERLLQCRRTQ